MQDLTEYRAVFDCVIPVLAILECAIQGVVIFICDQEDPKYPLLYAWNLGFVSVFVAEYSGSSLAVS